MARYKPYDYNQLIMIPVSLEEQLIPGTLEYAIHHLIEERIDNVDSRTTYSKRLGIVEPVFGKIRAQKRLDRFTLRGKIKVNIQWMLYCLVHNIEKILHFGAAYAMTAQRELGEEWVYDAPLCNDKSYLIFRPRPRS